MKRFENYVEKNKERLRDACHPIPPRIRARVFMESADYGETWMVERTEMLNINGNPIPIREDEIHLSKLHGDLSEVELGGITLKLIADEVPQKNKIKGD